MKTFKRISFKKYRVIEIEGKYYLNSVRKMDLSLIKINSSGLFIISNNEKYYEVKKEFLIKLGFKLERKKKKKIKGEKINDQGGKVICLYDVNKFQGYDSIAQRSVNLINYN